MSCRKIRSSQKRILQIAIAIIVLCATGGEINAQALESKITFQTGGVAWQDRSRVFTAVARRRPLLETTEGYSPVVSSAAAGALPVIWEAPVDFVWNFGDGTPAVSTGERLSIHHTYKKKGKFTLTLEMRNRDKVAVAQAGMQIEVRNLPPKIARIAAVEVDPENASLEFTAHVRDAKEDKVTYVWDFGDGETKEGQDLFNVTHQFKLGGTYPVTLTVRDEDEKEDTETLEVFVSGVGEDSGGPVGPGALDQKPSGAVVSGLKAEVSGGINATFDGTVRSMAGLHLGPVRGGACRFVFAAWDPSNLAHIEAVLDMKGIPEGGGRFRFNAPFIYASFEPNAKIYDGLRGSGIGPARETGLGGLVENPLLDEEQRSKIKDKVGVDPKAYQPAAERTRPSNSPLGIKERQNFKTVGGTFDLTFIPRDRAEGSFELTMINTDKEAPPGLGSIVIKGTFGLDLEEAQRDGMFLYDRCGKGVFEIEEVFPEDQREHVPFDWAIAVRFNDAYDPATVDENTFQVTYPEAKTKELIPITGRFVRDRERVWFIPEEPLMSGVRFTARIKTGPEGVRAKNAGELADQDGSGWYIWKFTSRVDIEPDFITALKNLACHNFQTVRDAPLIKEKPVVTRVYAKWTPQPGVDESALVRSFDANVVVKSRNKPIASTRYRFIRPDLWGTYGLKQEKAQHTANVFWTPKGDETRPLFVSLETQELPGEGMKENYFTSCPIDKWEPSPELKFDYYTMAVGAWEDPSARDRDRPALEAIVALSETYAWQILPYKSVTARPQGIIQPSRREWISMCAKKESILECSKFCDTTCINEILLEQFAGMTDADMLIALAPLELVGGGATFLEVGDKYASSPAIITTSVDSNPDFRERLVHALVHEMGHALKLEHLPYFDGRTVDARSELQKIRDDSFKTGQTRFQWKGIEGFRMAREGTYGWNKSSTEGNEESQWLTALMIPVTVPSRDAFITRHHYLDIQQFLESGANTGKINSTAPLIASLDLAAVTLPAENNPETGFVGIAGILNRNGELVILGPLAREELSRRMPPKGNIEVSLVDTGGQILASAGVAPAPTRGEESGRFFRASLPWNESAKRLIIRRNGKLLAERVRSANSPKVRLNPTGENTDFSKPFTVSWSASDADGDELFGSLLYSPDGLAPWSALGLGLEAEGQITVEPAFLQAGSKPTLRLIMSDLFNESDDTATIKMPATFRVIATLPMEGQSAPLESEIQVRFNTELSEKANPKASLKDGKGREIQVAVSRIAGGRALVLKSSEQLAYGETYSVAIEGKLIGRNGASLPGPVRWTFSIAASR